MSPRKKTVEHLAACFNRQDWSGMLPYLTDDVERWEVGAPRRTKGKKDFEREMAPGADVIRLTNVITRMVEEGNVVVSEGTVQVFKKDGNLINVQYCDLFDFEGEKVKRVTAYANVV